MVSLQQKISLPTDPAVAFPSIVYLPEGYDGAGRKKWPAIFYLHGRGERGEDYALLRSQGLPGYVEENSIPFIVLAPQCPVESEWVLLLDALPLFLDEMAARYPIDRGRICLTGNSMGGKGAWHLGIRYPGIFAAIVPICGGFDQNVNPPEDVVRLKDVPTWVFHGKDDDVVSIQFSRMLVELLEKAGGKIRHTYYDATGHDSWTKTYADGELYSWLLEQMPVDTIP